MSGIQQKSTFGKILGNIKRLSPQATYLPRDLNDLWNSSLKRQRENTNTILQDAIKSFDIDLKKEYRNVDLLNRFVTKMGLIKPRKSTGLNIQNQKLVSKSIRRARSMGLMAFTYRSFPRSMK